MTMQHKAAAVKIKAAGPDDGLADGQFDAIVSVFGNRDSYGDVVIPGAFTDSLAAWKASGNPIPVYWSHRMDDPDFNIGAVVEAEQTDVGLQVRGQLDLDAPKAQQVYRLMKGRRVTQFSFAYDVTEGAFVESTDPNTNVTTYSYEIRKADIFEVGPCAVGVNQETELLAVKSQKIIDAASLLPGVQEALTEAKAGKVLADRHVESLQAAHDAIGGVLSAAKAGKAGDDPDESADDQDSKASTTVTGKAAGDGAEDPTRTVSVSDLASLSLDLA